MINVKRASDIIQSSSKLSSVESIALDQAQKRILAKDILATREQPPFDRVAMDGIAIYFDTVINKEYPTQGIQAAGSPQLTLANKENCIEVMTGSILPVGCNCVVPYEKIDINNQIATINETALKIYQNIHPKGSDYNKGDTLIKSHTIINSPVSAIIASQGTPKVDVFKTPKLAIISTGSELVDLGESAKEYQIYMSNSYAIETELHNFGIHNCTRVHISDDPKTTHTKIEDCLNNYDILILTGGVSKGKFDYVPETLNQLGVEKLFHKIEQKPGKPMWYGTFENKQIFALPGNPVSSLVCLRRYVIPSLFKNIQSKMLTQKCILTKDIHFKKKFTLFAPVTVSGSDDAELRATPIKGNGSGDFFSLGNSSGFVELPPNKEVFKKGEIYSYYEWG